MRSDALQTSSIVLTLACLLCALPGRTGERPILVVFGVETSGLELKSETRQALGDYLTARLTASGLFEVVPTSEVKTRLTAEKASTYQACYDESCQIELGRELAAEKTVATKILKLGSSCTLSASLFDLKKATAERAATATGGCDEDALVVSMNSVVDRLVEQKAQAEAARECREDDAADCQTQCARKNAASCLRLARLHEQGKGVEKSGPRAVALFTQACDAGHGEACEALAMVYYFGHHGLPRDIPRSAQLSQRACSYGWQDGCASAGYRLRYGEGVGSDPARAFELFRRGCEADNTTACAGYGAMLLEVPEYRDYPNAHAVLERAAAKDSQNALMTLGWAYRLGMGKAVDVAKALELFSPLCEKGNAWGCESVAWIYKDDPDHQDLVQALALFRRAVEQGSTGAYNGLGWMHRLGQGVPANPIQARAHFQKGCELDNPWTCEGLGWLLKDEAAVRDDAGALRAFQKAAERSLPGGYLGLAWMYQTGQGVPADTVRAAALFRQACQLGNQAACQAP